jgi:two-component system nitrogen regulation sensor histidine kinase GlnL
MPRMIEATLPDAAPGLERMILSAITSSVLVVDGEDRIVSVNTAAEQLLGVGRTMLEGRELAEFLPFDSPLFDLVRRVQVVGSGVSDYGVLLPLKRGISRHLDLHVSPLAERPGHSVIVLHACSVAQRLNKQLSHRGGARSVAAMAATLAHEVRNPLSGIRGAAQLLEQSIAGEERPLIRLICDETDRISALVDRMEQFSDDRPIERRPVNIYQVLERVRGVAEHGFGRKVRILERYDPSLPEVDGDRDQLVQVFLNLVKNAVEATPSQGGEITLSTHYEHGLWVRIASSRERVELPITVIVEDNGPGVAPDLIGHLFEPFVSTKRSGSGLGLALVAKIVGDHGGLIEVENGTRGALFRVRLPAYRGPIPPAA